MDSLHLLVLEMVHIQDTCSLYRIHLITIWNKASSFHPKYVFLHDPTVTQIPRLRIPLYDQIRIEIDLDDGVKVNYEKFQGVEVAQEGKKALKVDLLVKIK